jgi:hypothetical protein
MIEEQKTELINLIELNLTKYQKSLTNDYFKENFILKSIKKALFYVFDFETDISIPLISIQDLYDYYGHKTFGSKTTLEKIKSREKIEDFVYTTFLQLYDCNIKLIIDMKTSILTIKYEGQ